MDDLAIVLSKKRVTGDIGLEIELEAVKPIETFLKLKGWRFEGDGSLKVNGIEAVLNQPVSYHNVSNQLHTLKKFFKENGVEINPSIRAGVHVHLNVQNMTIPQLWNFLACYYPLETVMTRFCGEGRENNLFCLRARDADGLIEFLEEACQGDNIYHLRTDALRYSALNLQSLFLYGSVEFRALGTNPNLDNIQDWVDMIWALKNYSLKNGPPWEILESISGYGGEAYARSVFGDELFSKLQYPNMDDDIFEDARLIQGMCYSLKFGGTY